MYRFEHTTKNEGANLQSIIRQWIHPLVSILALSVCASSTAKAAEANAPEEKGTLRDSAASPTGAVFVDPLGLALFGPTLGAELSFGQFSAIAYGRWLNAGLLAHQLFLNDNDNFAFSYGAGLKGRYYFQPGLIGPHLGVAFELLRSRTTNDVSNVAVNNTIIVPELEGGYRYGFGSFFIGVAGGVGYAYQASSSVENINGDSQAQFYEAADVSTIYGSANLDLGLFF